MLSFASSSGNSGENYLTSTNWPTIVGFGEEREWATAAGIGGERERERESDPRATTTWIGGGRESNSWPMAAGFGGGRERVTRAFCVGFGGGKERERAADGARWERTGYWWLGKICGVCRERESERACMLWTVCVCWERCCTVTIYSYIKALRSVLCVELNVTWISFS